MDNMWKNCQVQWLQIMANQLILCTDCDWQTRKLRGWYFFTPQKARRARGHPNMSYYHVISSGVERPVTSLGSEFVTCRGIPFSRERLSRLSFWARDISWWAIDYLFLLVMHSCCLKRRVGCGCFHISPRVHTYFAIKIKTNANERLCIFYFKCECQKLLNEIF
jgi:hypothetical protein